MQPALKPYDLAPVGNQRLEVAGTEHYPCPFALEPAPPSTLPRWVDTVLEVEPGVYIAGEPRRVEEVTRTEEVVATLEREPRNRRDPNAVRVTIDGSAVGYIAANRAAAWSNFLAGLEAEGYSARVRARVRIGRSRYSVSLMTSPLTPNEREERAALAKERETAGLCPECGGEVDRTENPRKRFCHACRPAWNSAGAGTLEERFGTGGYCAFPPPVVENDAAGRPPPGAQRDT